MAHIVGCKEAHELSTCKQGANQHAHIILRKNMGAAPDTDSETTDMTEAEKAAAAATQAAEVAKAARQIANKIAAMTDVTKAYYLDLADDKQDAFLAKSADDQKAEAEAAKAAKEKADLEAEAAKSGQTSEQLANKKRMDEQDVEITALKARLADQDIEKRAATEFSGYPGGTVEAVKALKSFAKLDDAGRAIAEGMMKAQCAKGGRATTAYAQPADGDSLGAASAVNTDIEKKIDAKIAAKPELTRAAAKGLVLRENPELMTKALNEEHQMAAAG